MSAVRIRPEIAPYPEPPSPPLPRFSVMVCDGCPLRRDSVRLAYGLPALFERHGLSPREVDVLRLLAQGLTGPEIADELGLAVQTAKFHTTNLFQKLGVRSRVAAARIAWEAGLR